MEKIIYNEHSTRCEENTKRCHQITDEEDPHGFVRIFASHCHHNPKKIIFMLGSKFYYVQYFSCMFEYYKDFEVVEMIIKKILKNAKNVEKYETYREDYKKRDDFLKQRDILKDYIFQYHYVYSNAYKRFCVVSKINYIEGLINNDTIEENAAQAKKELIEMGQEYLCDQVGYLQYLNSIYIKNDYHIVKTIDQLTKLINNLNN